MANLIPDALSDLNRLYDLTDVTSDYTDTNLMTMLINYTSEFLLRYYKRIGFKYTTVTNSEFHDGKGYSEINTDYYPIISITALYDDTTRAWGSGQLIDTDDYEIEDAAAGIVRRFDDVFTDDKSNVRVDYVAGYSTMFTAGLTISFDEGGSALSAAITDGAYNASSLATEVQTRMDAAGSDTWTCTYSEITRKYTIASDGGTANIAWATSTDMAELMGYDKQADDSGATSYASDYPVLDVPTLLSDLCETIVRWRFAEIKEKRIGKSSASDDMGSISFFYGDLPDYLKRMIDMFAGDWIA